MVCSRYDASISLNQTEVIAFCGNILDPKLYCDRKVEQIL